MTKPLTDIIRDGLWRNNSGQVQMLGLCPLLAVTTTTVNAIGLGVATMAVLLLSNVFASLARPVLRPETRIALFVLVIAGLVTLVDLFMHARFFELHRELGIFVPLIVSNCAILARAEVFASRTDPLRAALDGLMTGAGFMLVLVVTGTVREMVGRGSILADAHMLFGETWRSAAIQLFDSGFIIAALPPGAFIIVGLLIALRNVLAGREIAAALPVAETQATAE
ncbi:MAG: electron transport complex subunit E [Gammaproteobacteria bacterium]|nr:electron transport complex subunit E [Gammaproteobacteria bacterium]NNM20350.1 electron transport complex subunit E [Gammaproteobacteria bacterium]